MARPYLIAVIGKSEKDPGDPPSPEALRAAELVGANIAGAGAILITGGLSGVMEAASRGAKRANGLVIGMLPGFDKADANRYVDIALTTGMGWMRNTLVVRAADAVIMISGGIGTLNELTVAYQDEPPSSSRAPAAGPTASGRSRTTASTSTSRTPRPCTSRRPP